MFSYRKQQIILSKKPTGQQILALLNLFNILISDIYQKFEKPCNEILQNEKFCKLTTFGVIFGLLWGPWGQLKKSRKLHKYKSHEAKVLLVKFYG